jgi:hypothetical protein
MIVFDNNGKLFKPGDWVVIPNGDTLEVLEYVTDEHVALKGLSTCLNQKYLKLAEPKKIEEPNLGRRRIVYA